MRVTCVANSTLRLLIEPQTELERAFLKEMAGQSEKGTTTILTQPGHNEEAYVLEVGR